MNKKGNVEFPKQYDDLEPPLRNNNFIKTPTKKKKPYVPKMPVEESSPEVVQKIIYQ